MNINLREVFSKAAFIRSLNLLSGISSVAIDNVYKNVVTIPAPVIPVADLFTEIRTVGLSTRGGRYVNLSGTTEIGAKWVEPYPIRLKEPLSAVDLNNLKMLSNDGIEAWRQQKINKLRQTNRATTEYQAVLALKGKIEMPVITDDGSTATYTVDYGSTQSYTVSKKFDATDATMASVEQDLLNMATKVKKSGYGDIEFWAGQAVWFAIYKLIASAPNDSRTSMRVDGQTIITAAGKVILRNEEIYNPKTKVYVPTVAANEIMCIALAAPHTLAYAAIDDLDGGLQALPFFMKPVNDSEQGWKVLSESKPLPAPVIRAICWATSVTG
ncbi:MAG: major capsid protein [Deferribacterales bacterium]